MTSTTPDPARPNSGPGAALSDWAHNMFRLTGRASRPQYWWAWLFLNLLPLVVATVLAVLAFTFSHTERHLTGTSSYTGGMHVEETAEPNAPLMLCALAVTIVLVILAITMIPLTVRRLHDANLSGLLYLLVLIPWLGALAVLILTLLPSNPAGARFDQRW